MLVEYLIAVITVLLIYQRWKNRDIYEMGRRLNSGLIALPFFGHSYLYIGNNETIWKAHQRVGRDALEKENGLTSLWLGQKLYTVMADPVDAEFVMKTSLQKDDLMNLIRLYIGNGSIFAPVSIWKPRRKVLLPTFSTQNIKHFFTIFSKQSNILTEQLSKTAGTNIISIWKYLNAYTMDVAGEAALGCEMHAQKDSAHKFLHAIDYILTSAAIRLSSPWLYSDVVYRSLPAYKKSKEVTEYVWEFCRNLIRLKRKEISEERNKNQQITTLELLIRSSGEAEGYTDTEIIEELLVILIAGTDTSAVASSFMCLMLARHPEVQEKIFEELRDVFGDSERPATLEDLQRLKYLDVVIKETIRLFPPVPLITRKVEEELILPSGFKLVPGTGVMVHIWAIHRNPIYWGPDAEQFRPERFIDMTLKHPAAFMPFSFGPRNCVGYRFAMMSIKTVISAILRDYKLYPPIDLPGSMQAPIRLQYDLMMKDVDKFQIRLERRLKNNITK